MAYPLPTPREFGVPSLTLAGSPPKARPAKVSGVPAIIAPHLPGGPRANVSGGVP